MLHDRYWICCIQILNRRVYIKLEYLVPSGVRQTVGKMFWCRTQCELVFRSESWTCLWARFGPSTRAMAPENVVTIMLRGLLCDLCLETCKGSTLKRWYWYMNYFRVILKIVVVVLNPENVVFLSGCINKQSIRYWSVTYPRELYQGPLHIKLIMATVGSFYNLCWFRWAGEQLT